MYSIAPGVDVLIVTYGCIERARRDAVLSHEHSRLRWFKLDEVAALTMPDGYKASIRRWGALVRVLKPAG